jgi:hypothetical protein
MLPSGVLKAATIAVFLLFGLFLTIILRSDEAENYLPQLSGRARPIPNIVHFTYLKKNSGSGIRFDFEMFLSLYSAALHMKPSAIYIHTDHNATYINETRISGNKWTKKALSHPKVKINYVETVDYTNGRWVEKVEAKSDFVRWEMVDQMGGLYIDWDVLVLRNLRIFREASFNCIVGRQPAAPGERGLINSGTFMCRPRSALSSIMRKQQYVAFDGGWITHAVHLVTAVAERLVKAPGEVLILDEKAMAPILSWNPPGFEELFALHDERVPLHPQVNDPTMNPYTLWENRVRSLEWELDFSATYLLHAFKPRGHSLPGFKGVTPRYVLERNSNFGLAAWPTVQQMLRDGVITEDDDDVYGDEDEKMQ